MYRKLCTKIIKIQKVSVSKSVLEVNYPMLTLLSNLGIFSFKVVKCNSKLEIVEDKKRTVIPTIFLLILTYIFFDFMVNKSIFFAQTAVSENVFYVIFLAQLASGIASLLSFFPFNSGFLKTLIKLHSEIQLIDKCLIEIDVQKVWNELYKYFLCKMIIGVTTILILFAYYAITTAGEFGTITTSIKLCCGYFLPFIQMFAMTFFYANMVHTLRRRINCINNILNKYLNPPIRFDMNKNLFLLENYESKLKKIIKAHLKLCDLVEDINIVFGLVVTICIFSFFVLLLVDMFTKIIYIASVEVYIISPDLIFGAIWDFLCQTCLFILPFESGKLDDEVCI